MENKFNLELSMDELEIIKRGLRVMHSRYKMAYAEAHSMEQEQKQLERAMAAQELLNIIEDIIGQAKADEAENEAESAEETNAE